MAVNSSKQFQIMIHNKKVDTFVINGENMEGSIEMIKDALESGLLFKLDDNSIKNIKQHFMIIQSISFGLIINSKIDGYFPLSASQILQKEEGNYFSFVNIQNTNVCLKLIWQSRLILKQWMGDERKWRLVLVLLMNMLERNIHTVYISNELIEFILTLMNTNIYWTKRHFIFLTNHHFPEIFMKFLKHIYITMSKQNKKPPSTLYISLLNATKILYMYYYKQKNYKLSMSSWMEQIKNVVELEICLDCEIQNPNIDHLYVNWDKMITIFFEHVVNFIKKYNKSNSRIGRITTLQKKKIISKKYDIFSKFALCGNINCINENKYDRLKICKGCMMIYYCSKHCQKVDWKNIHKKQCEKLFDKMNGYNWNLVCSDELSHDRLTLKL